MDERSNIESLLQYRQQSLGRLIRELRTGNVQTLDLTARNDALALVDLKDTAAFEQWIADTLRGNVGLGGFMEDRVVYRRSEYFSGDEARSLHLGIDIWTSAGTLVYAPWEGTVHSFQDNQGFGNYGPTIILEHTLSNNKFYTLYGHLSRASLAPLVVGQPIAKDERLGAIGPYPENGDWPPHLHFQAMTTLLGWQGDFPGVIARSQKEEYAKICIDPAYLLRMD